MKNKPLISIITVVYNGEAFLEQAIQSVVGQAYPNIEYIIIDGGSTDGTVDIIKKYEDKIDYWVSEKDDGIYDAMNKGIKASSGELVGMINADDYYEDGAIATVANRYMKSKYDVIYGDLNVFDENKNEILLAHNTGLKYKMFPYSFHWIWANMIFGHPTTFVKKSVYDEIGLYDTQYRISGDYDFFFRAIRANKVFHYIQKPLANFRLGGVSDTAAIKKDDENMHIRKKNGYIFGTAANSAYRLLKFTKSVFK